MKKNFDMDAAIKRALRESIEAHAHEWEPNPDAKSSEIGDGSPFEKKVCKGGSCGEMDEGTIPGDAHEWEPDFKTGVGPVGDDAPFDNKVSESCNKEEACCPKCGKEKCECGDMNEGTIPGDAHEWEPDFKTGVGPVGDDNPFTQAVNESFTEGGDWEKGSFGAGEHKKEGIAFADGGDECQNGVVATSQKNSGEVVSKDNLSEGFDEEEKDETEKDENKNDEGENDEAFGGLRRLVGKGAQAIGNAAQNVAQKVGNAYNTVKQEYQAGQQIDQQNKAKKQAWDLYQKAAAANKAYKDFIAQHPEAKPEQGKGEGNKFGQMQAAQQQNVVNGTPQPAMAAESKEEERDVIKEERDRFFGIINRIEKLYD